MSCSKNLKKVAGGAARNGISPTGSMVAGLTAARMIDEARQNRNGRVGAPVPANVSTGTIRAAPSSDNGKSPTSVVSRKGVDPVRDALLASLSQRGQIDWAVISATTGLSPEQAQAYAVKARIAFLDPSSGKWLPADEYLSGNVRVKLAQAEQLARHNPFFKNYSEALQAVQPKELAPGEISAGLGAGWIPESDIREFAGTIGLNVRVQYVPQLARWEVRPTQRFRQQRRRSRENTLIWGTRSYDAITLLEQALNGKEPTVKRSGRVDLDATYLARDRQTRIKDAFERWLWRDPGRARRLAQRYNEAFNAVVPPRYDGSHLDRLPGMSPEIKLRPHQKDSIWRQLRSPSDTLLAHPTGTGKTNVLVAVGQERKRLGLAKKVMHVVPNHRVSQHANDFRRLYPQARLLVVSSEDMKPAGRNETLGRIATAGQDYDAVIIGHSACENIPLSPQTEMAGLRQTMREYDEVIDALPAGAIRKRKKLVAARGRLEAKLVKLEQSPAPAGVTWEELGIDYMAYDESHRLKNLGFATRHQNIGGINPAGSARARNMLLKVRHVQRRCDRCGKLVNGAACENCGQLFERKLGNVCFATATILDNSLAEIYTWQRFLQPDRLKALGLEHFDAWSAHFARANSQMELAITGQGYKESKRFSSFMNVPELSAMFGEVIDTVDPEVLDLPLPKLRGGQARNVLAPMSERQRDYVRYAEERAGRVRAREVSPTEDNYLKIMNDLHKASLDFCLIDPAAPDNPNSKVNRCVADVLDTYRQGTKVALPGVAGQYNLTQAIFLDTSTPKNGEFNLYDDIKTKLIKGGIPADEIAFIHDAKNDAAKEKIFSEMNQGRLRVLLASTQKAGEGTNMQRLLTRLHHLDCGGWTPGRLVQRDGRILRQGNLNPEVEIVRYVAEGPDAYRWQTIERKALASDQFTRSRISSRDVQDIGEAHADYATIKSMASNNPLDKERTEIQLELQRLKSLERGDTGRRFEARQELAQAQAKLEMLPVDDNAAQEAAQLKERIGECRAILEQPPFEHADQIQSVQQRLGQIDKEIAKMNRPLLAKKKLGRATSSLMARLMGRNKKLK